MASIFAEAYPIVWIRSLTHPLFAFDFAKRVVLDTNVLLNATFVRRGLANRAVEFLARKGTPAYVPEEIETDLRSRAARLRMKFNLNFDPVEAVLAYANAHRLLFCPKPTGQYLKGIGHRDEPIARSARQLSGVLITDDIKLIIECRSIGVSAVQPWEVARSYRGHGELPEMLTVARILAPASNSGYLFARVEPDGWKGLSVAQVFTVADAGAMRLSYNASSSEWALELPQIGIAKLRGSSSTNSHFVLCGQYGRDRGRLRLTLQVAQAGQRPAQVVEYFDAPSPVFGKLNVAIGHNQLNENHLYGYIRDIVMADGSVARDTFRRIASTLDCSPNPHDGNKLEEELANLGAVRLLLTRP